MTATPSPAPPLTERVGTLLMAPTELFEELSRRAPLVDALGLSSVLHVATSLSVLALAEAGHAPRSVVGLSLVLGVAGLWAWLATAAFVGMAFAGFAGADLPYRAWLSLATHCSLVAAVVVPVEIAAGVALGAEAVQPDLAWALGVPRDTLGGGWLARVSTRSVAFLALFSAGAATFTGRPAGRAASFIVGAWAALWFVLAWFGTLAA